MIIAGKNISIERSARRKTLSIFIERDGSVRIIAPENASEEKIASIIKSKEYLIYKNLAKWSLLNKGRVQRDWVNGQSFLYLGKNHKLNIVNNQKENLLLKNGRFNLRQDKVSVAEKVFKAFYREKGLGIITGRIKLLQKEVALQPKGIKVLELKNRWASWSPTGNLNFHWKCIMAPVSVLDYIIAHELIHLKYPNHSKAFWNELDKIMPKYRDCEAWLKSNGVKMNI